MKFISARKKSEKQNVAPLPTFLARMVRTYPPRRAFERDHVRRPRIRHRAFGYVVAQKTFDGQRSRFDVKLFQPEYSLAAKSSFSRHFISISGSSSGNKYFLLMYRLSFEIASMN